MNHRTARAFGFALFAAVGMFALSSLPGRTVPEPLPDNLTRAARGPLLAELPHPMGAIQLRAVNPATLEPLADLAPIEAGTHYKTALSRDGATLAVARWTTGQNAGGGLRLIDLSPWTSRDLAVTLNDDIVGPFWSGGDTALLWALPGWRDRAHGMPRDYSLVRYDLATGVAAAAYQFADSFTPWSMRALGDDRHVAVFGVPTDVNNLAEDVAHVEIVDLVRGTLESDLRLEGVKAGQYRTDESPDRPWRLFWPGVAWDVPRDRLYVVAPDEPRILPIDLLRPAVAEAKGVPSTQHTAVLSPDGTRLTVTGVTEGDITPRIDGPHVYETSTLSEVGASTVASFPLEPGFNQRGHSPDGHYAYAARQVGIEWQLRSYAVATGTIVAERTANSYFDLLLADNREP